jgi:hypothetical protein
MSTSLLYRTASVLLVLFALGHTAGFRSTKDMEGIRVEIILLPFV